MFKTQIGPRLSNILVTLYLLSTLALRFYLEPQLQGEILASVGIGLFSLFSLWALIKGKVLQPSFFTDN